MIKRSDLPAYISPRYHPWRPSGNQFIAPYLPTRLIAPSPSMYAPSNNTLFVPEYKGLTTVARPYSHIAPAIILGDQRAISSSRRFFRSVCLPLVLRVSSCYLQVEQYVNFPFLCCWINLDRRATSSLAVISVSWRKKALLLMDARSLKTLPIPYPVGARDNEAPL